MVDLARRKQALLEHLRELVAGGPGAGSTLLQQLDRATDPFDQDPAGHEDGIVRNAEELLPLTILSVWLAIEALELAAASRSLEQAQQHAAEAREQLLTLQAHAYRVARAI